MSPLKKSSSDPVTQRSLIHGLPPPSRSRARDPEILDESIKRMVISKIPHLLKGPLQTQLMIKEARYYPLDIVDFTKLFVDTVSVNDPLLALDPKAKDRPRKSKTERTSFGKSSFKKCGHCRSSSKDTPVKRPDVQGDEAKRLHLSIKLRTSLPGNASSAVEQATWLKSAPTKRRRT
jgi:hypothetical protein